MVNNFKGRVLVCSRLLIDDDTVILVELVREFLQDLEAYEIHASTMLCGYKFEKMIASRICGLEEALLVLNCVCDCMVDTYNKSWGFNLLNEDVWI